MSVQKKEDMELLRFITAGSVDDGKSTLIGRLLYDNKLILNDQMRQLYSGPVVNEEDLDLSLLTDGLKDEREQKITIDVAYRYFSTRKRKFIVADSPGHERYTRNMVTGASTADLAIVLVDARNGIKTQSRRHGFIASLLGIKHLILAVNKMDLVNWQPDLYEKAVAEYSDFLKKLNIHDIIPIPISALHGDNIVKKSTEMPWYDGPTLMHCLDNVVISADENLVDFRFVTQHIIRPDQDFRGAAGRISSGTIRQKDEIVVLPSLEKSRVKEIIVNEEYRKEATQGDSVVIQLEDDIDIGRGHIIARELNVPEKVNSFEANVCWMDDDAPLKRNNLYILKHALKETMLSVREIRYKINVNTLHKESCAKLKMNEIARVVFDTSQMIFIDPYEKNKEMGSFILVDPSSFQTSAAGMIVKKVESTEIKPEIFKIRKSSDVVYESRFVSRQMREDRNGYGSQILWLTGLSAAGKSTIGKALEKRLFDAGKNVYLLDGDNTRHSLSGDLGFSESDRAENIRRNGHVARMFYDSGFIVICSFISPKKEMRNFVRSLVPDGAFNEVYIKCEIEECKKRDPKGLYRKALSGEIKNFTGIDQDYEIPENPEVVIDTMKFSVSESVESLIEFIIHSCPE